MSGVAPTPVGGSFRDPAGRVVEVEGVLLRSVAPTFADEFTAFIDSGLYGALTAEGLLVEHDEVDAGLVPGAWKVLRPQRIPVVSYPTEWSPAQLRAAALTTLRVQELALEHGMVLRDASAYNVQFRGTRPVFVDTLSFGRRVGDQPWTAYGQFCRHFLAPLALAVHVDVRLMDLQVTHLDGIPLDLAAALLPARTRLTPGLLAHLHLHAKAIRTRPVDPDAPPSTARFSDASLRGLVDQLRRAVERLVWEPGHTTWSDYYDRAEHYEGVAEEAKVAGVAAALDVSRPDVVLDLGANTGRYSRLAAERGATVVAADVDHGAVERAFLDLVAAPPAHGSVLPLRHDLTAPTPAVGWANRERTTLAERVDADLVLALALIHHLAVGGNVPLDEAISHLAGLGRHLLVEWVPKGDPKVRTLLATREDVFASYTPDTFERALVAAGRVVARYPVTGTGRELVLLDTAADPASRA